jgi:hypothetical protein
MGVGRVMFVWLEIETLVIGNGVAKRRAERGCGWGKRCGGS